MMEKTRFKENGKERLSARNILNFSFREIKYKLIVVITSLLLLSLVVLAYLTYSLIKDVDDLKANLTSVNSQLNEKDEMLNILKSGKIRIIRLKGQDINPLGEGKIIWSPSNDSAILQLSNLPPTNGKESYQLWVIKNNIPYSEGVFEVKKPDTESIFKLDSLFINNLNEVNSFIITLEQKGGALMPAGIIYLRGTPYSQQ